MADGFVSGNNLICGVHYWDYRLDSGVSEYNSSEVLHRFKSWVDDDEVFVDAAEIGDWAREHPQPFDRQTGVG